LVRNIHRRNNFQISSQFHSQSYRKLLSELLSELLSKLTTSTYSKTAAAATTAGEAGLYIAYGQGEWGHRKAETKFAKSPETNYGKVGFSLSRSLLEKGQLGGNSSQGLGISTPVPLPKMMY